MGLHKVSKILALVIGVLGVVALANLLMKGDEHVKATGEGLDFFITLGTWSLVLIAVVVLFSVVYNLIFISQSIKPMLIGLGLFIVVVLISYGIAEGESVVMPDGDTLSESGSRWISAGLNAFYILGIGAIVAMLLSEAKNLTISK